MWVFLSRRLRMWAFFALGAPVLAWALGQIGDRIEARSGSTTMTRTLKTGRRWLQRRTRGPLGRRGYR